MKHLQSQPKGFSALSTSCYLFAVSQEGRPINDACAEIFLVSGKLYIKRSARKSYKINILALPSPEPAFHHMDKQARKCYLVTAEFFTKL